jgi:hypothetical protein
MIGGWRDKNEVSTKESWLALSGVYRHGQLLISSQGRSKPGEADRVFIAKT